MYLARSDDYDLGADAFVSEVMVGPCPRCGSTNTHDCLYDEEEHENRCELVRAIDDPMVAHCESCGSIFCTECGKVLYEAINEPLDSVGKTVNMHSKDCPEQQSERWTEKYGTIHRLISVDGNSVTISENPLDFGLEEGGEPITLRLSDEAGVSADELQKKVGRYLKFGYDDEAIFGVAEIDDDVVD